jgi:hypothetical protein
MNIGVNDMKFLVNELAEQLEAGKIWTVYEYDAFNQQFEHVHLFQDRDKALDYCSSNGDDGPVVRLVETFIFQQLIANILDGDKQKDEIDYYVIEDLSFAVSRILKTNPDQNALYNTDGNGFTDALTSHFERQHERYTQRVDTDIIANELKQYPLQELEDKDKQVLLVEQLLAGNKVPVHLEKRIIPATCIDFWLS